MSDAMIGYGTLLAISRDGGLNYTTLAEVSNLPTPPSSNVDIIDVTHYGSPDRTREFIVGLIDPGECQFDLNFIPGSATDVFLEEINASGEVVRVRITWPNSWQWVFDGIATNYTPSAPIDDKMTASFTMKVTGSKTIGLAT